MVSEPSWYDLMAIYLAPTVSFIKFWYGPTCLSLRLTMNVITVWSIVSYMNGARTNMRATALAILLAASSGYMFFQGASRFDQLSRVAEMGLVIYTFCITYICLVNRGNMAKPLRSLWKW